MSVSSFVPKPHTPFQWERQIGVSEIREKQSFLKKRLRDRNIVFKWHDAEMSLLEGVFSRGDERLGRLIETAFRMGARFDGWTEKFNPEIWKAAMDDCGINADEYLRQRDRSEPLPWDNIDCGVSREFLEEEADRALRGDITADCRRDACTNCGVCGDGLEITESKPGTSEVSKAPEVQGEGAKYRIFYTRTGEARHMSHLETTSALIRALRRSGVSFKFSSGFHPHPKISFVYALPVGVESDCECAEMEINGKGIVDPKVINESLPGGMAILSAEKLNAGSGSISARHCRVPLFFLP